tara:strand:- start:287 stop:1393 length:1107 start_codon:yes stop_codon:yes gene_type:complete
MFFRFRSRFQKKKLNDGAKMFAPANCVLTEWIDPKGMAEARQDLSKLLRAHPAKMKRLKYLRDYLDAVDRTYGNPRLDGPNGYLGRPLDCIYTCIRSGRMYCMTHRFPAFIASDQPRYICTQGMPSVLRPYLMRRWVHDLDIANCHVTLMFQLGKYYHAWPEHAGRDVEPLHLNVLQEVDGNRAAFIQHVADAHYIDQDADHYPGYRKEFVKPLLLRVMYGGSYEAWMEENGLYGHKCQRVVDLEREMRALRRVVVSSMRFAPLAAAERSVQERRKRSPLEIERGIFSKIAQHLECVVLMSMCDYLASHGWRIHSLVYDGLTVEHRADTVIDTSAIERHVEGGTQFIVSIVEKPLFSNSRPDPDSLLR